MSHEHQSNGLILQGRHLTKTFGGGEIQTRAVDDVSLDLHAGQVVVLMGPSGSGKSTLLALLSGLLPPTGGQVVALGQDLWALSDPERRRSLLAPLSIYPMNGHIIPLPFSMRRSSERYLEQLTTGRLLESNRIVLVTWSPDFRNWLDGRLRPLGFRSHMRGDYDPITLVEYDRSPSG